MYDYTRWGHYWAFTALSLKRLFEQFVPSDNIKVKSYGNPKIASAFVYGLCQEDLNESDFMFQDETTPVTITAIVIKPII